MFNAEAFKSAAISEVNADRFTPVAEGDYVGSVVKADIAAGESSRGPWARYDVTVAVNDPTTGDTRNVRGGIMLDLNDSGGLATGQNRNIKLGQLRTAIGKNVPGKPYAWGDAVGCPVAITVKHRADKDDATKLYEDIISFKAPY